MQGLIVALALSPLATVVAAVSGTITDPSLVNGQTFDYVVVGGGLGGLTVANRLSENPDTTVLYVAQSWRVALA